MDVTLVELSENSDYPYKINDLCNPANLYPHIGAGLGGTTKYWHNGLMEIDECVFAQHWPYSKSVLNEYYQKAFLKLSKKSITKAEEVFFSLRKEYIALGVSESLLKQWLFYPNQRLNVWNLSSLKKRVRVIPAEVIGFKLGINNKIESLEISSNTERATISSDIYVLAAGGIGTPVLLQKLAKKIQLPSLHNAGRNYEDHPAVFVAEVITNKPFYRFWNYKKHSLEGNFRIPFTINQDSLKVSFQLRPAYQSKRENSFISILNDLRNNPLKVKNYFNLLAKYDDLFEILSFKLGFNFPTRKFSVLMVAEQITQPDLSIERNEDNGYITRKWIFTKFYFQVLEKAIDQFFLILKNEITNYNIFSGWQKNIASSAHHSGTARMSNDPNYGVCDENGQVYGLENLYISDGSMIPASGFANTGLTIAALSLKLGKHLENLYKKSGVH